jgi:hypothetical protein
VQAGQPLDAFKHIAAEEIMSHAMWCQTGNVDDKDDDGFVGFVVRSDLNVLVHIGWYTWTVGMNLAWSIRDTRVDLIESEELDLKDPVTPRQKTYF